MNTQQSSSKREWARAGVAGSTPEAGAKGCRPRNCLCCGNAFASGGSHERICGPCKDRDDWSYGAAVTKGHIAW